MNTTSRGPENNMTVSVHFSTCLDMDVITRALACYENNMTNAANMERSLYPDGGHYLMFRERANVAMDAYRQIIEAWGGKS